MLRRRPFVPNGVQAMPAVQRSNHEREIPSSTSRMPEARSNLLFRNNIGIQTFFPRKISAKEITREKRVEMRSPLPSVLLERREPLLGSSRSGDGRPTQQRFVDEGQQRSQDGPTVARAHGGIRGRATSAALGGVVDRHYQCRRQRLLVVRWHEPARLSVLDDLAGSMRGDGDGG